MRGEKKEKEKKKAKFLLYTSLIFLLGKMTKSEIKRKSLFSSKFWFQK